jgi:hypothetical protein
MKRQDTTAILTLAYEFISKELSYYSRSSWLLSTRKAVKSKTGFNCFPTENKKLNASVDDDRSSTDGRHQAKLVKRYVGRRLLHSPSTDELH